MIGSPISQNCGNGMFGVPANLAVTMRKVYGPTRKDCVETGPWTLHGNSYFRLEMTESYVETVFTSTMCRL